MLHCFATPEYDHDRFLSKLSYQTYKLNDQPNYKQYLQIVQDIYNYHAREDDRLLLVSPEFLILLHLALKKNARIRKLKH